MMWQILFDVNGIHHTCTDNGTLPENTHLLELRDGCWCCDFCGISVEKIMFEADRPGVPRVGNFKLSPIKLGEK